MNSVHPAEARLDRQGIFCRLVIPYHTFQGCGMQGAGIWMDWLSYQMAKSVQPKVQSQGYQDAFWAAILCRAVLPTLCYQTDWPKGLCAGKYVLMSVAE